MHLAQDCSWTYSAVVIQFCKGDKSLEKCSGPPSEGDNDQLRAIIKADLLRTTREVAKVVEEHSTALPILLSFGIWSKLERWKNSISGCLMSWQEIFLKVIFLKYHLLLFYAKTRNHFSIRLRPVMKSGFYITSGNDWLSGWTKKLQSTSQSQTK